MPAQARYYVRVLDKLGFRTTLRIQSSDDSDLYDPNTRANTGLTGWAPGYLAPSDFIRGNFECGSTGNISRLCDRTLERQIERAVGAPTTDVAAWTAADRRVVPSRPPRR